MPQSLIQEFTGTTARVIIKFGRTLDLSTITNDKFTVTDITAATPTTIINPFRTINLSQDYNSISRILTLHWNANKLSASSHYVLTISGFEDLSGSNIEDESVSFMTDEDLSDDPEVDPAPVINPVVIEDYSILDNTTIHSDIIAGGSNEFYVAGTRPENGEYYIENDYRNGRVTIKFSISPQSQFINSSYFKAQRKPLQRAPIRWETLSAIVSKDSDRPWVYIDFPALDDPEIHTTSGKDYFEENYKYRVVVSSSVKSE